MPIEKGLNLNTTLSTSADFDVNEENTWTSEPLHIVVTPSNPWVLALFTYSRSMYDPPH